MPAVPSSECCSMQECDLFSTASRQRREVLILSGLKRIKGNQPLGITEAEEVLSKPSIGSHVLERNTADVSKAG